MRIFALVALLLVGAVLISVAADTSTRNSGYLAGAQTRRYDGGFHPADYFQTAHSPSRVLIAVGRLLLILGFMAALTGQVMFLTVAYRHSLGWFLGCLFVPFISLIFLLLNMRETVKPLGITIAGLVAIGVGGSMAGVAAWG
jgi:hypothetical protein